MTRASLLVAIGVVVLAQAAGARQARPVSGDGGGLATFGDRGLTTFSDRGLTSFSDIPLAPMGGLEVPGPSARRTERPQRSSRLKTSHPPRIVGPTDSSGGSLARSAATSSVASLRGVRLPPLAASTLVVLPPIALPAVTLDHRPALAALEQALRDELARARQRGDADLARSLAAGMRR